MSVQFGRWSFDDMSPLPALFNTVNAALSPFGPDRSYSYQKGGVFIFYHAFHTIAESRMEAQPLVTPSGKVITWDGRLDNRAELIQQFPGSLTIDCTDLAIVSNSYERWGTDCFSKLIGDWALSIWSPEERALVLAKDIMGTRQLYYSVQESHVTWCSVLDPLVLLAERQFELDEEYIAGWLSGFPAAHLTPYLGMSSVPPASFVRLQADSRTIKKYWDFDPTNTIHYRTDKEYEEHFRIVFREAVLRRLRSDAPILAELSGGLDSSSIVCMADQIIASRVTHAPRLDTVSYFNDSEPNWNERPYFAKVEQQRGRVGCHINVGTQEGFSFEIDSEHFAATPGSSTGHTTQASRDFVDCLATNGNRVVLSGIGGDEVTGGMPTPDPELMNLLARGRFLTLVRKLHVWALNKRKPWIHLLAHAAHGFLPSGFTAGTAHNKHIDWLTRDFGARQHAALRGYRARVAFLGPLPSFQENLSAIDALRRQLASSVLRPNPAYEKRYPFLDRNLLEFLLAVPREQIVRPGQRRSLMRRALLGIVPDELLNRKRKAFMARSSLTALSAECASLVKMCEQMTSASRGIVDSEAFRQAILSIRSGGDVPIVAMLRTLEVEAWLRNVEQRRILVRYGQTEPARSARLPKQRIAS